jgi:hypothetical protein
LPELPELPELPLPEPPDLPLPDPPAPIQVPIPDPDDLPLPDPGELPLPDPGDLPLPDPGELPNPGDDPVDNPKGDKDPGPAEHHEKSGGVERRQREDGRPSLAPTTALNAARGGSSNTPSNPISEKSADQGAIDALAPFAFPILLILAVAAFVALQGYYDRKDPKLALGPVDPSDQLLTFD